MPFADQSTGERPVRKKSGWKWVSRRNLVPSALTTATLRTDPAGPPALTVLKAIACGPQAGAAACRRSVLVACDARSITFSAPPWFENSLVFWT